MLRVKNNMLHFTHRSLALCNSLRRILLAETPTLAIEQIFLHKNYSVMPDEQLVHRIGLIPIRSDKLTIVETEKCECTDICDRCAYKFKLDKIDSTELRSDDLKIEHFDDLISKNILLMKLKKEHVVQLRGYIRKGVGNDHSKFSPASAVSITFNENDYTLNCDFIEGIGDPLVIFKRAVEILKEKILAAKKIKN